MKALKLITLLSISILLLSCKTTRVKENLTTKEDLFVQSNLQKDSSSVVKQNKDVQVNSNSQDSTFISILDTYFKKDTAGIPFVVRQIETNITKGGKTSTVQTVKDNKELNTNVETNKNLDLKKNTDTKIKKDSKEEVKTPMPFNIIAWIIGLGIVIIIVLVLIRYGIINFK